MQPDERLPDSANERTTSEDDFVWPPASASEIETFAPDTPDVREVTPLPRLSEVLESGVAFEWHHAVAVIQQLLSQLAPEGDAPGNFPDASRIWLTESGDLVAEFIGGPQEPLGGLGSLLQQTLSGRVQPAALRLLVMQATAAQPTVSLAALRSGFAQWERPNRRQTIANLYAEFQKAGTGGVVPAAAATLTSKLGALARAVKRQAPPPAQAPAEARAPKQRKPIPPIVVFVAAGFVFTAVLLTLVFMTGSGPAPAESAGAASATSDNALLTNAESPALPTGEIAALQPDGASAPVTTPPATATPTANAGTDATAAPAGQTSGARSATGTAASRPPAAGRAATSASNTIRPAQPAAGSPSAQPGAPASGPPPQTRLALDRSASSGVPIQPLESPDPGARSPRFADDTSVTDAAPRTPIYSAMDSTVLAPVTLSTLPPAAEPSTPEEDLAVLELIIDTTGHVESARLLNTVQHFRDRWWIAAAKTWAFRPALLNGRPVRYRTRLTFINGAALGPPVADR